MELDDDNDSPETGVGGVHINYNLCDVYTNPTGSYPHASAIAKPHLRVSPPSSCAALHALRKIGAFCATPPRRLSSSIPYSNSNSSSVVVKGRRYSSRANQPSDVSQPAPGPSTSPISPRDHARPGVEATTG
ncbi:hypothetical protein BJY52DRAFT_1190998 [Lactarius psammicola]|nr:hypothetical protein BJY52DRAFT_1190998 [Lactarius psammicola]